MIKTASRREQANERERRRGKREQRLHNAHLKSVASTLREVRDVALERALVNDGTTHTLRDFDRSLAGPVVALFGRVGVIGLSVFDRDV